MVGLESDDVGACVAKPVVDQRGVTPEEDPVRFGLFFTLLVAANPEL